jgi:hypothetical protein
MMARASAGNRDGIGRNTVSFAAGRMPAIHTAAGISAVLVLLV